MLGQLQAAGYRIRGFHFSSFGHSVYWAAWAALGIVLLAQSSSLADPLPGRDVLKFQQRPLDNLTYPVGDPINGFQNMTYWGHDNFSTAYSRVTPDLKIVYDGRFMADDFADLFNSPVVHIKWWGSYPVIGDGIPVDKFLISFEEDIPADPSIPGSFSRPGQPLLNQIVTRGPISKGSGTFSETPYSPGGPPLFEQVFEYNAELNLGKEFHQQADKVYWLKIVALVDVPPGVGPIDPNNPPAFLPRWGWHNRDYSITNPYASTSPNVVPGEHLAGFLNPTPAVAVYHFQDDAVAGGVFVDPIGMVMPDGTTMPLVQQDPQTMQPTRYLDGVDGPGVTGLSGPIVMSTFSQDLAFELYTIPEPSCFLLALVGFIVAGQVRRRHPLSSERQ
jgi:hypothetical protein